MFNFYLLIYKLTALIYSVHVTLHLTGEILKVRRLFPGDSFPEILTKLFLKISTKLVEKLMWQEIKFLIMKFQRIQVIYNWSQIKFKYLVIDSTHFRSRAGTNKPFQVLP